MPNHNCRSIHSGCNLSAMFMIWFCVHLKRVHHIFDLIFLSLFRYLFPSAVSILSSHYVHIINFFICPKMSIHTNAPINLTSLWKYTSVISNRTWSFPSFSVSIVIYFLGCLFTFDIVIPVHIVHMFTWFYEGGVDLAWPISSEKFATWQETTPIKSSSSSFKQ